MKKDEGDEKVSERERHTLMTSEILIDLITTASPCAVWAGEAFVSIRRHCRGSQD